MGDLIYTATLPNMMPQVAFRRSFFRYTRAAIGAVVGVSLVACGDDGIVTPIPQAPLGILVLDGFIQPGLTFLGDTGTASTKLAFGPSTEFDAGGFTLERDTVLATSSRSAGDLLYITDLTSNSVRRIQLPARSNPGRARLFRGSNGQAQIAVALRDSSVIALVNVAGAAAPTITRIANAGQCPTDMFQYDNATWVVDANASCRTNYALLGNVRLIRIPNTGTTRDTIQLPALRSSGASAIIINDVAYITAGGDANFSVSPFVLNVSGAVARVDLRGRRVLSTQSMPTGTYGASMKRGLDGFLYVSIFQDLANFRSRVVKMRPEDLSFVGGTVNPWLPLTDATGAAVSCGSGQADALGRVHCIQNGTGSVTSLLVFTPTGTEVRRVRAGQGGVDMAIRGRR